MDTIDLPLQIFSSDFWHYVKKSSVISFPIPNPPSEFIENPIWHGDCFEAELYQKRSVLSSRWNMIRKLKLFIESNEGVVADVDYEQGNYFHGGATPGVFVSLDSLPESDRVLLRRMLFEIRS